MRTVEIPALSPDPTPAELPPTPGFRALVGDWFAALGDWAVFSLRAMAGVLTGESRGRELLRVCAVTDWLDPSKAKVDFEKAIELGADEYCLYGILHSKMGEHEKAIKAFTAALEKQPNDTDLLLLRGNEKSDHKEYSGASADYEAVLKIDPKSSDSLNALAWLKATCPEDKFRDGKKADELAREACELTGWKRPVFFGALAAGYAETGDFSEAVEWQEKAINEATVSKEEVEDMRLALNNYKSNKPHRDK